jgi:NAD+ diphosphatase
VPRPPNVYAGPYLDRVAALRKDAAAVESALHDATARLVPVHESRSLVVRTQSGVTAVYLEAHRVVHELTGAPVLLGRQGGCTYFAGEFADAHCALAHAGERDASFEDLRLAGGLLPHDDAGVLAYARAMLLWRRRHRHCGACGAPTVAGSAGHVMTCSDPSCATEHFPRLDPAIIVLVTDGERALLGRQAAWPEGRYSTIAGFVEPGESLEDAVAREVLEETGVHVLDATYHSSQPWPFPSSLMIGYTATASPDEVPRAEEELEDARWFTREDVAGGFPGLPPPQSVSYRLIEDWYDAGATVPLRATPGVRLWGAPRR